MKIKAEKIHKCEYCGRWTATCHYVNVDIGELLHERHKFCCEYHADIWLRDKYQLPLPFLEQVPCSNNGTNIGGEHA
jgi:hypothetical protein